MGMDVYGINPKQNKKIEDYPVLAKYKNMEFREKWEILDKDEELKDKYFREDDEFLSVNKGEYFRNNVWWWRPLWDYCYNLVDFITDEDWNEGHNNGGHIIDETKASMLGTAIFNDIEDGNAQRYIDKHIILSKERKDNGDKYADHYPMDINNLEEFATFCLESGGFRIS